METRHEAGPKPEGPVARKIEEQTSKLPSDLFLWIGVGSLATSLMCQIAGSRRVGTFLGQAAQSVLIMGLYNKIVKLHGSDKFATQGR